MEYADAKCIVVCFQNCIDDRMCCCDHCAVKATGKVETFEDCRKLNKEACEIYYQPVGDFL